MINVTGYTDRSFEPQYVPFIGEVYDEAATLLDRLPETANIRFSDEAPIDSIGVGGNAASCDSISIAINKDFRNRSEQLRNLRSTVLHEAFHLQQGFTRQQGPFTALESAAYEGCATVFEREYADNAVLYGAYEQHPEEELRQWLSEIRTVGTQYYYDKETWQRWAFYHPEKQQQWIVYKLGTWLVDRVLRENQLDILDLRDKTATEVLSLAGEPS